MSLSEQEENGVKVLLKLLFSETLLEFFEMLIALQLLSMEISVRLGNDVDMPRNLAKSVTVEQNQLAVVFVIF